MELRELEKSNNVVGVVSGIYASARTHISEIPVTFGGCIGVIQLFSTKILETSLSVNYSSTRTEK